jgi:3-methyladenine DNA glycosylase/8-oxoguanine DNA glycosylase
LKPPGALEIEVRPAWPLRLPGRDSPDGVLRVRNGVVSRLLHVEGEPVVVRTWRRREGQVVLRAVGGDETAREIAVERMRFALGVDEDLRPFYDRFRGDSLLAPAIRRMPWVRPRRRPWPWEALAWAVTKQLIDTPRAAAIQRRIVWLWGPRVEIGMDFLRDVPGPDVVGRLAPAELEALDLSGARSIAMIQVAREVARGRVDPAREDTDKRLRKIREIGPWTIQCLGLLGRGDPDSLPAGDLGYIKLVGHLAGLGRRATVEEVEEFFAPYAPYRGLAGTFILRAYHRRVAQGPPLKLAA